MLAIAKICNPISVCFPFSFFPSIPFRICNLGFWSSMADMNLEQSCQSPSTLMPSTPLQLSGFLTGDTIQVKGDAGNLKFSVQFSVQEKQTPEENHSLLNSMHANACFPENGSNQNSSFSSYMTPNDVQEAEDHQSACTNTEPILKGNEEIESCDTRNSGESNIMTRLRSGMISPVNYSPRMLSSGRSLRPLGESQKLGVALGRVQVNSRKKNAGKLDVFERVFRRHSSPIRPCTSYAFFVMATWGFAKSSSFGETSKQLGRMWCQLPQNEKKLYKKMAMKDNARYKKQCMKLMQKGRRGG